MPRRAALCKRSILLVTPIASRCLERLSVTAPNALTTMGTTFALTLLLLLLLLLLLFVLMSIGLVNSFWL